MKWSVLLLVLYLLCSCSFYDHSLRYKKIAHSTYKGEFNKAISAIKSNQNIYGKNNHLLYYADLGILYHYAKKYDSSNVYLEKVVTIYERLYTKSISKQIFFLCYG